MISSCEARLVGISSVVMASGDLVSTPSEVEAVYCLGSVRITGTATATVASMMPSASRQRTRNMKKYWRRFMHVVVAKADPFLERLGSSPTCSTSSALVTGSSSLGLLITCTSPFARRGGAARRLRSLPRCVGPPPRASACRSVMPRSRR